MENKTLIWEEFGGQINHMLIDASQIDEYAKHYANKYIIKRALKQEYVSHNVDKGKRLVTITLADTKDSTNGFSYILLGYRSNEFPIWENPSRKIIFKLIDSDGNTIKSVESDYYDLCHRIPPEDYPGGYEPMRKNRYTIQIGNHEYLVSREGQILEQITRRDDISEMEQEVSINPEKANAEDILNIIRQNLEDKKFNTSHKMYCPQKFQDRVSFAIMNETDKGTFKKFTIIVDDVTKDKK